MNEGGGNEGARSSVKQPKDSHQCKAEDAKGHTAHTGCKFQSSYIMGKLIVNSFDGSEYRHCQSKTTQ